MLFSDEERGIVTRARRDILSRNLRKPLWLIPLAATVLFSWSAWQFHDSRTGFSSLVAFGERMKPKWVAAIRDLPLSVEAGGGYDGQFYAQMATDPLLRDPGTDSALDLAPFRARRILFSWTAYLAGLGKPARIIQMYAVQNIVCWFALGLLAFQWFPPTTGRHVTLWIATAFAGGLLWSVRGSLLDGPSLLVIVLGMLALERDRPWLSAALFGIGGLGRETNVLAAAAQVDTKRWTWGLIWRLALQLALIALPLLVWFDYLYSLYRSRLFTAGGIMAAPLEWFWWRWRGAVSDIAAAGWHGESRFGLLILVSLAVQALFIVVRPRWKDPWWRLACAYLILMLFLGHPVWEANPSAVRVLLPMNFAFNVMLRRVDRPSVFWPLVVAGNLSVLFGLHVMRVPGTTGWL